MAQGESAMATCGHVRGGSHPHGPAVFATAGETPRIRYAATVLTVGALAALTGVAGLVGASEPDSPGAEAVAPRLRVAPRPPLAVAAHSPSGASGQVGLSEIADAFEARVDALTGYAPERVEPGVVAECEALLACLVRRVRGDYAREDLARTDGTFEPFAAHRERVEAAGRSVTTYLLLLTHVAVPGRPDRLAVSLVDTDAALRIFHEAPRAPGWAERVEDAIERSAIAAKGSADALPGAEDLRRFADVFFRSRVAPVLAERGTWRPFAEVHLRALPPGTAVTVDGRLVGASSGSEVVVADLVPGPHRIELAHPSHHPATREVEVSAGGRTELELELERRGSDAPRAALFWSGLATAVAGGVVLGVAVARDGDARSFCFEGPGCSGGDGFTGGSDPEPGLGAPDSSGLLLAPLGYSLMLTGATWSVGSRLEPKGRVPWISTLAGLVAGGLAYGVSAAVSE